MDNFKYKTVRDFYKQKCIFLTGATGFMGKVLLEKLLRCCPDIDTIYLLLRPKRGQAPELRLKELLDGPVFERLHNETPNVFKILKVVSGDVSEEGLGMSPEQWNEVRTRVQVIFHCAACVRFDMTLRYALTYNTLGTKRVLEVCKKIENLESMIYVSTTYCHCDELVLEERVYEPKHNPHDVLECLNWMDDDVLTSITPALLGNQPNTYAYSKCLCEKLVSEAGEFIPIAIARPSIVTSSHKEPMPGYVDNLNGPTGLMVGAGKGVLRSMHCKPDYHADVIPVDFACNGLITMAWYLANNSRNLKQMLVANLCADANETRISWGECLELGRKFIYNMPFSGAVWYPDGSIKNSKLAHELCVIFFHNIPAYIIDALAVLFRQKPFMVNIQRRIQVGLELLQYYTTREWHFDAQRIQTIAAALEPEEREIFNTDANSVVYESYMRDMILGTRKYILKDDPSTIPKARRHMTRLYWLDKTVRVLFYIMLFWTLYSCYNLAARYVPRMTFLPGVTAETFEEDAKYDIL